jgi:hypothetical protein
MSYIDDPGYKSFHGGWATDGGEARWRWRRRSRRWEGPEGKAEREEEGSREARDRQVARRKREEKEDTMRERELDNASGRAFP